jgi:hypothetical protein
MEDRTLVAAEEAGTDSRGQYGPEASRADEKVQPAGGQMRVGILNHPEVILLQAEEFDWYSRC